MTTTPDILTVTQLNRQIRTLLEQDIGEVAVGGEISNLTRASSGHCYFTLKDASAQIRCVYFRKQQFNSEIADLANGMQVVALGNLSLYESRGDFQLIVQQLQNAGIGDLFRQFEQLKLKLDNLGLFDVARKRSLPQFPQIISVVTSSTSAAVRDILITLQRRYPIAQVKIFHSEVQGVEAPQQLCQALNLAYNHATDIIILARGGGSMEDLWAFNNEYLAHTIASSPVPIVTGIGHETDFTIADFVADMRAATPTAAAEAATPNIEDLYNYFIKTQNRIEQLIKQFLSLKKSFILSMGNKLHAVQPQEIIKNSKIKLLGLENKLQQLLAIKLNICKHKLAELAATINTVSPLATLSRGYAIASLDGKVIYNTNAVVENNVIDVRLTDGALKCKVLQKC